MFLIDLKAHKCILKFIKISIFCKSVFSGLRYLEPIETLYVFYRIIRLCIVGAAEVGGVTRTGGAGSREELSWCRRMYKVKLQYF